MDATTKTMKLDQAARVLLEAADDPDCTEFPLGFDRTALLANVVALVPELERIMGHTLDQDFSVQDATFCGDLATYRPSRTPNLIESLVTLRFSNFGRLFTTSHSCDDDDRLPADLVAALVAVVARAGFVYVPGEELERPYSGRHPGFIGQTWWDRFFDYT